MNIKGIITRIYPARDNPSLQKFVFQTEDSSTYTVTAFGDDKIKLLSKFNENDELIIDMGLKKNFSNGNEYVNYYANSIHPARLFNPRSPVTGIENEEHYREQNLISSKNNKTFSEWFDLTFGTQPDGQLICF